MYHHEINAYEPSYSVSGQGPRRRVLVTTAGERTPTAQTRTVLTVDADAAVAVVGALTALVNRRKGIVHDLAVAQAPGVRCHLRRSVMAAVAGDRRDESTACVHSLADTAAGLSEAERRALAEEVGRLFDGVDDILVPACLSDDDGQVLWSLLANRWLAEEATDADVTDLLLERDEPLFEGLLSWLRFDTAIDDECLDGWVDVHVDLACLAAWARAHRPHLIPVRQHVGVRVVHVHCQCRAAQ